MRHLADQYRRTAADAVRARSPRDVAPVDAVSQAPLPGSGRLGLLALGLLAAGLLAWALGLHDLVRPDRLPGSGRRSRRTGPGRPSCTWPATWWRSSSSSPRFP